MPRVSVIIPTFNRCWKVSQAITSVFRQTFSDYEIFVVDDGSTDGTQSSLLQFGSKIHYVKHTTNRGVSAARNAGILKSSAPLIAFLDSDDSWLPDKLATQIAFFERHAHAEICQTEEIWIRNARRVNPKMRHQKPSGNIFEPSLKLCLVSPSAVMLKRSLLEEVGLFDEELPACEDYDLWLRISCRHAIYLIKQHLVVKEGGHKDQLSRRIKGLDRFRIQALEKLLKSGTLGEGQIVAVMKEIEFKCGIYGRGCLKRGKNEEGFHYLQLPKTLKETLSIKAPTRIIQPFNTSLRKTPAASDEQI